VGLVWAGGKLHTKDACRSCGLQALLPILQVSGVRFYGLQKGQPAQEVKTIPEEMSVINYGGQLNDFADTAALLANLDLVISVDTAVAHLAGAMAKPVWVLLPYPADWRWLLEREDSPWYPTMRLFRQHEAHDWKSVIMRVAQALKELVTHRKFAQCSNLE
jgi:ADP-heptose:LPS heptosyltransferase